MTRSSTCNHDELEQRLQALADRAASSRHVHSLLLAVESDDRTISIRTASGAANPEDPYFIASITKMVTAGIVMQLIDEQRLRLDARVVDLLPQLDLSGIHRSNGVDHTPDLQLRHLLHQTSGLPDYFVGGLEDDFKSNRDRRYTIEDIIEMARVAEANFPPGDRSGTRSAYSDTNYQLLTAIIEAATGSTYARAVDERIVEPLGLTRTWLAGHEPAGAPAPLALHHKAQALDLSQALASEQGAGGIVSTLDEQLTFMQAYHDNQLFDSRHTNEMRRWNRIFFPVGYGYGLMRYRLPRVMTGFRPFPELIGHSGSTNSFAFYAPELQCHIVGTLNQLDNPARAFRLLTKVTSAVGRAT